MLGCDLGQGQRLQELYSRLSAPEQFIIGFTRTDAAGVQFCNYNDACENDGTIYQEDDVAPNPPNNAAVRLKYRYLLESGVEYVSHVQSPAGKMVKRLIAVEGSETETETETAEDEEDPEGWMWVEDYIYRRLAQEGDEEDPDWVVDYIYRRDVQAEGNDIETVEEEDPDWVVGYTYRQQEEGEEEDPDWVIDYVYRRQDETETESGVIDGKVQVEDSDWVVDYIYRRQDEGDKTTQNGEDPD